MAKPMRVLICGIPNVGKSTLINTWLGEERLVAFDQPGTTRDALEARVVLGGVPITLVDTAGLREAADALDADHGHCSGGELCPRCNLIRRLMKAAK